jgi:hypothetical protein
MRRSTLDKVRENFRLQQVYNTLLRYGYDTTLNRAPVLGSVRHSMQSWAWRLPKGWEEPSTAVKIRLLLEELGQPEMKPEAEVVLPVEPSAEAEPATVTDPS